MKLTIESMTYGADGLAHADNGKAVFVQGAVAGDTVEAEVAQDGKSFMRARTTEILEPSPDRIQPPCPYVGICGGCSWGNLSRTAQLAAKEQNLRSTLERIGKFAPEQVDELVQPICHTKDDWGYRNKIELEPTVVNGRVRLGMHGVDPSKIVTVDACPLFDKRFPKALKSVVGALNYLSGSHDLGLERVGIRASRRTKALEGRTLDAHRLFSALAGLPRAGGRRSSHEHRSCDEQGRKESPPCLQSRDARRRGLVDREYRRRPDALICPVVFPGQYQGRRDFD